jgi:hypothetical protein
MRKSVVHHSPVWSNEVDSLVRVDLDAFELPDSTELIWAHHLGGSSYLVCCIPFFPYGLALGDVMETDAQRTFLRVAEARGHRLLRIALLPGPRRAELRSTITQLLAEVKLLHEWHNQDYCAIDLPGLGSEDHIVEQIRRVPEGDLHFEVC